MYYIKTGSTFKARAVEVKQSGNVTIATQVLWLQGDPLNYLPGGSLHGAVHFSIINTQDETVATNLNLSSVQGDWTKTNATFKFA